jgi:hypothetical protein
VTLICARYLARRNRELTGGEQDQGSSGVDNTSSAREDRSGTILDRLVDTPVEAGRVSRRRRAVRFRVSMEVFELEPVTTRAYMFVIDPVNLVESVPPNVNSPFWFDDVVVGSKDTETRSDGIVPWLNRLSVTVGIGVFVSGNSVPTVKSTGPILEDKESVRIKTNGFFAHPRIPSKPSKPLEVDATPMDCFVITSPEEIVTVSKYSVPNRRGSAYSEDDFRGEKHTRE